MQKGYVQVYTGDGKGKTTAAIGLCVRASGAGLRVLFAQFLKDSEYSEIKTLEGIPGVRVEQYGAGLGFLMPDMDKSEHRKACEKGLAKTMTALSSGAYDLVVLDEINCAVALELLRLEDALNLIDMKPDDCELVFTGRNAAQKIIDRADLVTEMREIKHYYQSGVQSREGIEN